MAFSLQYKGFDYVAFYNGAYEDSDSLPSLVQTGANSIEATLDYGIDVATSQVVADPNYTDSLAALGNTIAQAESLGMSVMVRPLIDFLNPAEIAPYSVGEWRQDYQPTNIAAFFASYQQMIVAEAQVAQQNGAQMLSIGAELDQLAGPLYLSYWTSIINAVHAVFSGELTYSASWNTASNVSFWSQLNYEGIDCYVPLSNAQNPTLQDLINGWTEPATAATNPAAYAVIGNQSPIQYFENLVAQSGKPLLFTELGYANDSGAAADPSASGNSPNPALQAELYQAFFQAWGQSGSSSLIGAYFWEWDPNGSTSNVGPGIDSFSPQNSPAQNAATAGFDTLINTTPNDFLGNGYSDILLHNGQTLAEWDINGTTIIAGSGNIGPTLGSGWSVALTGDFNGDGQADLLLQNGQQLAEWLMNGTSVIGGGNIDTLGSGWTVAGTGDFNADGYSDILLQNGQQLAVWEMNGTSIIGGGGIGTLGSGWTVAGTGDFYANGHADILLKNGQQLALWEMNGTSIIGGGNISPTLGSGWTVAGTGDFYGDGHTDILLKNGQQLALWEMNGTSMIAGGNIGTLGTGWTVVGTGDFYGDGHADILLQNGQQLAVWEMSGTSILPGSGIVGTLATGWASSHLV